MAGRVSEGSPEPLGVTLDGRGANIAVFSAHATAIELCLFDADGARENERLLLPARTGDVFHGHVAGLTAGQRYGLRAHGPFDPAAGHRFNPAKLLLDPYAHAIDRPFTLHQTMFGYQQDDPRGGASFDATDSAPFMPKAVMGPPPATSSGHIRTPWRDTTIYELHVRGFTRAHPDIPLEIRGTFAALAHPAAIGHLQRLGITTVEIMPAAAWIDERHLAPLGLSNYWGYNPVALMAPDPRLAPGGWTEVRAAVAALQTAGFEVILDMVLNHTGESDGLGPTLSLRGLDSASYYRQVDGRLSDDAGCGNVLALDRTPVMRLAMDSLRCWALYAGIDGFRFDLATTLGRRADGFDADAPLLAVIAQDPVLRHLKLIAEPWDIGPGGYRIGAFPAGWGEWNDRFRDTSRKFWRGDAGQLGDMATRFAGSADIFAPPRRTSRSVNFIVSHDGFTLADLVTYAHKHNEPNGEQGRDGTDANHSWNNGCEGPSDDPAIHAARQRDQRNLLATLMLARGTPMLAMGAELGHSQNGNNNAYAQDNTTSWLDWSKVNDGLIDFTSRLLELRRNHPSLSCEVALTGKAVDTSGIADVLWRSPEGEPLHDADWHESNSTLIADLYVPEQGDNPADRVLVVLHAGNVPRELKLPDTRDNYCWRLCLDTVRDQTGSVFAAGTRLTLTARSAAIFAEERQQSSKRQTGFATEALDRLAAAAGIQPEWSDISGKRHIVPNETRQALLTGLGLPCQSAAQARESLAGLADEFERRSLPLSLTYRVDRPAPLRIATLDGRQPTALQMTDEDGTTREVCLDPTDLLSCQWESLDGRPTRAVMAPLPSLLAGRYRLNLVGRPEEICHLTVAPPRCARPADERRRFGIAAQLYAVRRHADQGIGDFTTLAELAERSAAAGASTLGLNPMHMMFAVDRQRASPYHPSDRRFLDPIYLDIHALGDLPGPTVDFAPHPAGRIVDYATAWRIKSRALESRFTAFDDFAARQPDHPLAREFAAFIVAGGMTLQEFGTFEAISNAYPDHRWQQWPAGLAMRQPAALAAFMASHQRDLRYACFLQWLCERQLAAAAKRARAAGLADGFYRDLAIGAAPDGAESWSSFEQLLPAASIGAPPDPFAEGGQVWDLPPPNPLAWRRDGYRRFAGLLAANMRHAGLLRIDHVMGLARLFIVPEGATAADGAYLTYPLDDLLGQLALESTRADCQVVGEDLGTVPDGLRERLGATGVLSYRVLWFERDGDSFRPPETYPPQSVACVSTHDLPTLAGWWNAADITEKAELGLLDTVEARSALGERTRQKAQLLAALADVGYLPPQPDNALLDQVIVGAIHRFLADSPVQLTMVQLDDLTGEAIAVNLPGTDRERPNWRRIISRPLEKIFDAEAAEILTAMRRTDGRGDLASGLQDSGSPCNGANPA